MGWVAAALTVAGVAGTVVEGMGAAKEAEAAEDAAKYNARVAMIQARQAAESIYSQSRVIKSQNVTRIAKSGVRMQGSPLAVLAENEFKARRAAQRAMRTGNATAELYRMQADASRDAGRYGIASAALRGAGSLANGSGSLFSNSWGGGGGRAFSISDNQRTYGEGIA